MSNNMAQLHQQVPPCADFDVLLAGQQTPSFRVLVPERILGHGVTCHDFFHTIPGDWRKDKGITRGSFAVADQFAIDVAIKPSQTGIGVVLGVTNRGQTEISDVRADICAGLNRLPGNPAWCNERFLPAIPLDRDAQGRYWYEKHTPKRLFVLTKSGWVAMHPCPDDPDADKIPPGEFRPSDACDTCACAVESADGGVWYFQAWDASCRRCPPRPASACMHIQPFIAERLLPGARAEIHGRFGMHHGNRQSLEAMLRSLGCA